MHICPECQRPIDEVADRGSYRICMGCGGYLHIDDCWDEHLVVMHNDDCEDENCGICHLCQGPHLTKDHKP